MSPNEKQKKEERQGSAGQTKELSVRRFFCAGPYLESGCVGFLVSGGVNGCLRRRVSETGCEIGWYQAGVNGCLRRSAEKALYPAHGAACV